MPCADHLCDGGDEAAGNVQDALGIRVRHEERVEVGGLPLPLDTVRAVEELRVATPSIDECLGKSCHVLLCVSALRSSSLRAALAASSCVSVAAKPTSLRRPVGRCLAYPEGVDAGGNGVAAGLPGSELIEKGIADLALGVETIESLLVSIGAARLARLGHSIPSPIASAEHRLYERLAAEDSGAAHGRYNALVRRLVSFERAAECAS